MSRGGLRGGSPVVEGVGDGGGGEGGGRRRRRRVAAEEGMHQGAQKMAQREAQWWLTVFDSMPVFGFKGFQ